MADPDLAERNIAQIEAVVSAENYNLMICFFERGKSNLACSPLFLCCFRGTSGQLGPKYL